MASLFHLVVQDAQDSTNLVQEVGGIGRLSPQQQAVALAQYFTKLASGNRVAKFQMSIENAGGAAGTWTIACTRANAADNYVVVAGITFTEGVEFVRGATDTTCGANLAAAINASTSLTGLFASVAAVTGTITLTMSIVGIAAQQVAITTDDVVAFAIVNTGVGTRGTNAQLPRVFLRGLSV